MRRPGRGDRDRRQAPRGDLRHDRDPSGVVTYADVFRAEWGQVVATLIRMTGDWELAEECAQEACAAALERWPRDGVPDRPGAWLTTTARNRAIDWIRREAVGAAKLQEVAAMMYESDAPADDVPDDRL